MACSLQKTANYDAASGSLVGEPVETTLDGRAHPGIEFLDLSLAGLR